MPLTRSCPICKKELVYKSKDAYHMAVKKDTLCRSCTVKQDYINHPNKNKGNLNGRKGKSLKALMKNKYGTDKTYEQWIKNKHKFGKGTDNPSYGIPGYKNSGCSYKGWYKGLFFRSSLELLFIFQYEKTNHILPLSAEGTFRIKYNDGKNYIPDFFCPLSNNLYEIKCSVFLDENKDKFKAGTLFCESHGLNFVVLTEHEIDGFTNYDLLVPDLAKWHKEKTIVLTNKSIEKITKRLKLTSSFS